MHSAYLYLLQCINLIFCHSGLVKCIKLSKDVQQHSCYHLFLSSICTPSSFCAACTSNSIWQQICSQVYLSLSVVIFYYFYVKVKTVVTKLWSVETLQTAVIVVVVVVVLEVSYCCCCCC